MTAVLDKPTYDGLVTGLANEAYHKLTEFMSSTALKQLQRSPAHYKAWLEAEQKDKPAFREGRMAHTFILEPDTLRERYEQVPASINKRTKAYQEIKAQAAEEGRELIDEVEWVKMVHLRNAVRQHELAGRLMEAGQAEVSVFWKDNDWGTSCRCRPDWISETGYLVDLKTTSDANPERYYKDSYNLGYHLQAAFYLDGYTSVTGERPKGFLLIAIEKDPPFAVVVYKFEAETLTTGRNAYKQLLLTLEHCKRTNAWPAYADDHALPLGLPSWAV